jgi:hypothetical protein
VASRLVERWRRPCVVIALEDGAGRGSGRSIRPYDLHAGLSSCSEHLLRFGGHRMAAGLEIEADRVAAFRRELAAHAGAHLTPDDLIPVEDVDAVVPGVALGLPLAEELEQLRPFGIGNPQPTLLVPAARLEAVAGMGEDRQHARFTLVTPGSRSRGVAFGSPPRSLAASAEPHDLALRLEKNRWNGTVEPRVILRAMCPTRPGELRIRGEDGEFWERVNRALAAPSSSAGRFRRGPRDGRVRDRRGEGFAGVAGDLLSSGEPVLVAVAHVERRRASLESVLAGLASDGLAVAFWGALAAEPELARPYKHLLALDPPPGAADDQLLADLPVSSVHLAWGPPEVDFALAVYRSELDLRPALADAYRALRDLSEPAGDAVLQAALCGGGRYPRSPELCALLLIVLAELDLAEVTPTGRAAPVVRLATAADRTELERSTHYRACQERLGAVERVLGSVTAEVAVAG